MAIACGCSTWSSLGVSVFRFGTVVLSRVTLGRRTSQRGLEVCGLRGKRYNRSDRGSVGCRHHSTRLCPAMSPTTSPVPHLFRPSAAIHNDLRTTCLDARHYLVLTTQRETQGHKVLSITDHKIGVTKDLVLHTYYQAGDTSRHNFTLFGYACDVRCLAKACMRGPTFLCTCEAP